MDEYEKLEEELQDLFRQYVERFRNIDYLEREIDLSMETERKKMEVFHDGGRGVILQDNEAEMQRMQNRLKAEDLKILRGEEAISEAALDDVGRAHANGGV